MAWFGLSEKRLMSMASGRLKMQDLTSKDQRNQGPIHRHCHAITVAQRTVCLLGRPIGFTISRTLPASSVILHNQYYFKYWRRCTVQWRQLHVFSVVIAYL